MPFTEEELQLYQKKISFELQKEIALFHLKNKTKNIKYAYNIIIYCIIFLISIYFGNGIMSYLNIIPNSTLLIQITDIIMTILILTIYYLLSKNNGN